MRCGAYSSFLPSRVRGRIELLEEEGDKLKDNCFDLLYTSRDDSSRLDSCAPSKPRHRAGSLTLQKAQAKVNGVDLDYLLNISLRSRKVSVLVHPIFCYSTCRECESSLPD
jgi:hypothetical protein